jgi:hypothetical protein
MPFSSGAKSAMGIVTELNVADKIAYVVTHGLAVGVIACATRRDFYYLQPTGGITTKKHLTKR